MRFLYRPQSATMTRLLNIVVSFVLIYASFNQANNTDLPALEFYKEGDINRCFAYLGEGVERFEALPGIGWDNLENRDGGQLIFFNYSKCQTTDDGRYLIPDNIFTVPLKTSRLEIFGEIFNHWTDYTSSTASSINLNADLQKDTFSISGSFSAEFANVKKHQIADKSITTRVQAKYVQYTAKLQTDSPLSPSFRRRLKNIAFYVQKNMTTMASYASQILVRDFGTHVLSSTDAGAIVTQIDEVKSTFAKSLEKDSSKIVAAASASFQSVFKFDSKFETTASSDIQKQYEGNRTHSVINAIGGPMFKPHNFTLNDWASQVKTNLVSVDRLGFPIYELITLDSVPELPPFLLYSVVEHVKHAIEDYYQFNMYRGCTDIDSPQFSYMANVDDGSCTSKAHNYSFGGIYQTCSQEGQLSRSLCAEYIQKNPLTANFSCPVGYKSIFLSGNKISSSELRTKCTSCGLFYLSECCSNYYVHGSAVYKAYWCVGQSDPTKHDGFLFGGIFSDAIDNPVTQSRDCPQHFYQLKIGAGMQVCVSDDYELGYRFSVPFAGFFSCKAGNPLAIEENAMGTHDLSSYLSSVDPDEWPRRCPSGYSMHLASVEISTCAVNYCVQAGAFSYKGLPPIRRPPFFKLPTNAFDYGDNSKEHFEVDDDQRTWIKLTSQIPDQTQSPQGMKSSSENLFSNALITLFPLMHLLCWLMSKLL